MWLSHVLICLYQATIFFWISRFLYVEKHGKFSFCQVSKEESSSTKSAPVIIPVVAMTAVRFEFQITNPMYPRKLIKFVSKMEEPSSNLLHHCHSHTHFKVSIPNKAVNIWWITNFHNFKNVILWQCISYLLIGFTVIWSSHWPADSLGRFSKVKRPVLGSWVQWSCIHQTSSSFHVLASRSSIFIDWFIAIDTEIQYKEIWINQYYNRSVIPFSSTDYRKSKSRPKLEQIYELPQATINLTKASLLLLTQIVLSWQQKSPRSVLLADTTLMEDNFVTGKKILKIWLMLILLQINFNHRDAVNWDLSLQMQPKFLLWNWVFLDLKWRSLSWWMPRLVLVPCPPSWQHSIVCTLMEMKHSRSLLKNHMFCMSKILM